MHKEYWLGRKRASAEMARNATCAIHFELAGLYSARAAQYRRSPEDAASLAACEEALPMV